MTARFLQYIEGPVSINVVYSRISQCPQPSRADRTGPRQGFRQVLSLLVDAVARVEAEIRSVAHGNWDGPPVVARCALAWCPPGVTVAWIQCGGGCAQVSLSTRRTVSRN